MSIRNILAPRLSPAYAAFPGSEHDARLARARAAMRAAGVDCVVCSGPENLFYLAGYDSWTAMNCPQGLVFTAGADQPTLLVRDVDLPLARESAWVEDVRVYHVNAESPAARLAGVAQAKGMTGAWRVAVDLQTAAVTGAWCRALEHAFAPAVIVDGTSLLGDLRLVKSPAEIAYLRRAAGFARAGLRAARDALRPGRTEIAVAGEVEAAVRAAGSDYPAIPTEFACGPRSAGCHATPRPRVIGTGELGHFEFAGVCERYHVTAITTLAAGEPGARARHLCTLAAASLRAGIAAVRPGAPAAEVEEASLAPLRGAGLADAAMMRFGYGIGIAYPPIWLETLQIDRQSTQRLAAGMVFVLHACLELPGEGLGVIQGGTWLLRDDGLEMLAGDGPLPPEVLA